MQSTSWEAGLEEAPAGIKIAGRNINNLRYADDTTLMAESEEELKRLLIKVKEESEKVGLKLNLFIPSGAISPLYSSSILGTCQPGELIFQCKIFLPFQNVHGVLKARMLKWFAIPLSSEPRFVRTLTTARAV